MELTHNDITNIAQLIASEIKGKLVETSPGRWLTKQAAMEYLSIKSPTTFKRLEDEGVIQGSYLGKSGGKRYDRVQLDDYLLRNRYIA
jgi:hypothetical protein